MTGRVPEGSRAARRPHARVWAAAVAAVVLAGVAGRGAAVPEADAALEARARALEDQLIAPCCFAQTVRNHSSPVVEEIRQDLRRRLRAGESEATILEAYRQRYGERILATPLARGFNVLAWVAPPAFVLLAIAGGVLWLRRRAHGAPDAGAPPPGAERLRERLEAELRNLEA